MGEGAIAALIGSHALRAESDLPVGGGTQRKGEGSKVIIGEGNGNLGIAGKISYLVDTEIAGRGQRRRREEDPEQVDAQGKYD